MITAVRSARSWKSTHNLAEDVVKIETIPKNLEGEFVLEMLMLDGTWQKRRVVWTKDIVAFARENQDDMVDKVPLLEVQKVQAMRNENSGTSSRRASFLSSLSTSFTSLVPNDITQEISEKRAAVSGRLASNSDPDVRSGKAKAQSVSFLAASESASADVDGRGYSNMLQIQTVEDGFNSGRTYYLKAPSDAVCRNIVRELTKISTKARKLAESRSKWLRYQNKVLAFYSSLPFQTFICITIITNFAANIADVQLSSDSPYHAVIARIDILFTSIFTCELLINAYAHWMRPFLADLWNAFDVVIIILSLVALGPINLPVSLLRLVRAFRVIRLFGRMRALKRILSSLSASIVPELNAFLIFFIVASICESHPTSIRLAIAFHDSILARPYPPQNTWPLPQPTCAETT